MCADFQISKKENFSTQFLDLYLFLQKKHWSRLLIQVTPRKKNSGKLGGRTLNRLLCVLWLKWVIFVEKRENKSHFAITQLNNNAIIFISNLLMRDIQMLWNDLHLKFAHIISNCVLLLLSVSTYATVYADDGPLWFVAREKFPSIEINSTHTHLRHIAHTPAAANNLFLYLSIYFDCLFDCSLSEPPNYRDNHWKTPILLDHKVFLLLNTRADRLPAIHFTIRKQTKHL